jgi:uncharacterized protein YcbX
MDIATPMGTDVPGALWGLRIINGLPRMVHVTALYRYPIKGLSPEPMQALELSRDGGVAHDRTYALALGTTQFERGNPAPLDKGNFLMLRVNEELARLDTHLDPETSVLTIQGGDGKSLLADLSTMAGRSEVESFFTAFAGPKARGSISLVDAPNHKFTDVGVVSPTMMRAISVINRETVRELEGIVGRKIHPLRFRANVYIDGLEVGAELDWVDREVCIGPMWFRGALRTRRCAAIDVNPITAERDEHLPKAIMKRFGHPDLGVYLEVLGDGMLTVGDMVFAAD